MRHTNAAILGIKAAPKDYQAGFFCPESPRYAVNREVKMRLLRESASYQDLHIQRHDLTSSNSVIELN